MNLLKLVVYTSAILLCACRVDSHSTQSAVTHISKNIETTREQAKVLSRAAGYDPSNQATATANSVNSSPVRAPNQCNDMLYQGIQPKLPSSLNENTTPLCYTGFMVLYSGVSRTPLWSAEHLTVDRLNKAQQLERVDNFHEDLNLPEDQRARLSDYTGTGFDRGHLAPNADMPDTQTQYESFGLSNIVPQNPQSNRKSWADLEKLVRSMTKHSQESYVVTGVSFTGNRVLKIKNHVFVPSHLYKAVYFPTRGQGMAFIAPNNDSNQVYKVTLAQLTQQLGVDPFPNLSPSQKAQ